MKEFNLNNLYEVALKISKSILIIVIGIIIIKILSKVINRTIYKKVSNKDTYRIKSLSLLFNSTIKYLIYFIIIVQILSDFGIKVESIIAISSVVGLAVSFASQNFIKDIISGIFIFVEDKYSIGDYISINNKTGYVESISLKSTTFRSSEGYLYIVPNGEVTNIINYNKNNVCSINLKILDKNDTDKIKTTVINEIDSVLANYTKVNVNKIINYTYKESEVEIRVSMNINSNDIINIYEKSIKSIKDKLNTDKVAFEIINKDIYFHEYVD